MQLQGEQMDKSETYKERDVSHTKDTATQFIISIRVGRLWSVI
jgi:hypothetical protein